MVQGITGILSQPNFAPPTLATPCLATPGGQDLYLVHLASLGYEKAGLVKFVRNEKFNNVPDGPLSIGGSPISVV